MPERPPPIPLSGWADRRLRALAEDSGSSAIATLTGAKLLSERAALNRFHVPGSVSAGGGCRLYETADGWIALSLARSDDRSLLPALFRDAAFDASDDDAIARRFRSVHSHGIVVHGTELGLAIAAEDETPESEAVEIAARGAKVTRDIARRPLVVDLSALWAGPLATRLLRLAGAAVVKVESASRPDAMRAGDPAFFARLNGGKTDVAIDLRSEQGLSELRALIDRADIVIEASRPRALRQLGIDADALVDRRPGLVWTTITGHGVRGAAANRIGFGDDCGVAGGLTAALRRATGETGFVGDAIADPLTGVFAAKAAWHCWQSGQAVRVIVSMSGVVAKACAEERERDGAAFDRSLCQWAAARGDLMTEPELVAC